MSKTNIEWADVSVNPFVGCQKVSAGCDNCYALKMAWRLAHNPNRRLAGKYKGTVEKVEGKVRWTGRVNEDLNCMEGLYKGPKGKVVFVGSMGDIAFENLHFDLFSAIMNKCYSINNYRIHGGDSKKAPHQFMFLTKRPDRFLALWAMYFKSNDIEENRDTWQSWPLHDDVYRTFWVGATIENQKALDKRGTELIQIPAANRFISYEPALGPLENLGKYLPLIDLVICGGESGPGARPVHPDWVRGVRDQCLAAKVPFFFKQWGEWAPFTYFDGENWYSDFKYGTCKRSIRWWNRNSFVLDKNVVVYRIGKKLAGREFAGKEYLGWPK